jgi:hypothetical protein
MGQKEIKARIKINELLKESGWKFWKYKNLESGDWEYISNLNDD